MKVNDSSMHQAASAQLQKAREAEANKTGGPRQDGPAQTQPDSDRVHLSNLSGRLVRTLSMDSPDRVALVERLAADYKAGRYQPDALAASRGIINDAMHREP